MTMTLADFCVDDGGMGPQAGRPKRRRFTAEYKAEILAEYVDGSLVGFVLVGAASGAPELRSDGSRGAA
jgi:hypothetical protein